MSEIKTGGPAFPIGCRQEQGMTIRDYFAGHALSSIAEIHNGIGVDPKAAARAAYQFADAMIAEKFATDPKPPSLDDDRPF